MAKRICKRPEWLKAEGVADIYSLSDCVSEDFTDYINYWKHNGFWLFDSPEIIRKLAYEHALKLEDASLFYYEVHEQEFDGTRWQEFKPEKSSSLNIVVPRMSKMEGFDVVTFWCRSSPEHSPLSCNSLAEKLATNEHCLFASFDDAETSLNAGAFVNAEPGPYRVFSVYSVEWT